MDRKLMAGDKDREIRTLQVQVVFSSVPSVAGRDTEAQENTSDNTWLRDWCHSRNPVVFLFSFFF